MKLKVGIVIPFIIGFLTLLTSCAKDTEIIIHEVSKQSSVITSDLIVTTLEASAFIDKSSQQERVMRVDTTNIDLITTDFFKEEMTKSKLSFQFKNTLDRAFRIDFEFLNERNEIKFELQIPVSSGTKEKPARVETSVVIEIPELNSFKEATKVVYRITLLSSDTELTQKSDGSLELRSAATYFFDI